MGNDKESKKVTLYAVYQTPDGEIRMESCSVIESVDRYHLETSEPAWHWRSAIPKELAHLTPQAAKDFYIGEKQRIAQNALYCIEQAEKLDTTI